MADADAVRVKAKKGKAAAKGKPAKAPARTKTLKTSTKAKAAKAHVKTAAKSKAGKTLIKAIRTATLLEASGSSDDVSTGRPKVTAYYSVIERAVEVVPVPDSFAWARINRDGQVVAEAVYWPALPAGVLAQARRMSQGDALSRAEQAIKARPGEVLVDNQVTIRHTSAAHDKPFAAHASIDVRVRLAAPTRSDSDYRRGAGSGGVGAGLIRHFDAEGMEFQLPEEVPSVGRPPRSKQRTTGAAP